MAQATTTMVTVEEFERLQDDGVRRELVRGEVIEITPSGAEHSMIGAAVVAELRRAARASAAGVAFGSN